jgi:hypothetical protein
MNGSLATSRRRLRFSVRALLVLMFAVAVSLWAARAAYERRDSISLADAVGAFNASAQSSDIGKYEPPLTEKETIGAISRQLPLPGATAEMNAIFSKIARTGRIPKGAFIDDIPTYQDGNTRPKVVWWIDLTVMTRDHSGYRMRIRKTDDPVAARIFPGGAPPTRQDILQWTPPRTASADGRGLPPNFD